MWDRKYPTHIEVPEDYWVYSYSTFFEINVEYSQKDNKSWYLYLSNLKGYGV